MDNNPRVFISYAHKNQAYEDKVLKLANRLRSEGIDAYLIGEIIESDEGVIIE